MSTSEIQKAAIRPYRFEEGVHFEEFEPIQYRTVITHDFFEEIKLAPGGPWLVHWRIYIVQFDHLIQDGHRLRQLDVFEASGHELVGDYITSWDAIANVSNISSGSNMMYRAIEDPHGGDGVSSSFSVLRIGIYPDSSHSIPCGFSFPIFRLDQKALQYLTTPMQKSSYTDLSLRPMPTNLST
ncbi:hypothetical protein FRC05_008740 [Tulasnella sp. 425]|nr:hypothetical protein FRC05_008740 [Tulasnella sp. 425]